MSETRIERVLNQVQELPWATRDDMIDAKEDVERLGWCRADLVFVDGDLRMQRVALPVARGTM